MSFAGDLNGRLEKSQSLCVPLRVSTLPDLWTYHVWATLLESNGNRKEENNGDGIHRCWERKKSTLFSF